MAVLASASAFLSAGLSFLCPDVCKQECQQNMPLAPQRGVAMVLSLYSGILRCHRERVPAPMRVMDYKFLPSSLHLKHEASADTPCCMQIMPLAPQRGVNMVLSLYRGILRCHRERVPAPMRVMGDEYVRDEFRRHWSVKTTEAQWRSFLQAWTEYLDKLEGRASADQRSGQLDEQLLSAMSEEQRMRLSELKEEIHESAHRKE